MNGIKKRRPRSRSDGESRGGDERGRAPWRATGKRIEAFKSAPAGTTSAEFNARAAP